MTKAPFLSSARKRRMCFCAFEIKDIHSLSIQRETPPVSFVQFRRRLSLYNSIVQNGKIYKVIFEKCPLKA